MKQPDLVPCQATNQSGPSSRKHPENSPHCSRWDCLSEPQRWPCCRTCPSSNFAVTCRGKVYLDIFRIHIYGYWSSKFEKHHEACSERRKCHMLQSWDAPTLWFNSNVYSKLRDWIGLGNKWALRGKMGKETPRARLCLEKGSQKTVSALEAACWAGCTHWKDFLGSSWCTARPHGAGIFWFFWMKYFRQAAFRGIAAAPVLGVINGCPSGGAGHGGNSMMVPGHSTPSRWLRWLRWLCWPVDLRTKFQGQLWNGKWRVSRNSTLRTLRLINLTGAWAVHTKYTRTKLNFVCDPNLSKRSGKMKKNLWKAPTSNSNSSRFKLGGLCHWKSHWFCSLTWRWRTHTEFFATGEACATGRSIWIHFGRSFVVQSVVFWFSTLSSTHVRPRRRLLEGAVNSGIIHIFH